MGWWPCECCEPESSSSSSSSSSAPACIGCDGDYPAQFEVLIAGLADTVGCSTCDELNGIYYCDFYTNSGGVCYWTYTFPSPLTFCATCDGVPVEISGVMVKISKVGMDPFATYYIDVLFTGIVCDRPLSCHPPQFQASASSGFDCIGVTPIDVPVVTDVDGCCDTTTATCSIVAV